MAESPMPTVLFISVFVLLFFKFCLGGPQLATLGILGPLGPLGAPQGHRADALSHGDEGAAASNMAADWSAPLPLVRKCPVGTVYSVAVGGCKDLVRSNKNPSQKMQLLMPFLLAATQQHQ